MFLVSGRLSDLFGRRWFFIGGNCICLIGVIVGACAQNMNTLIVASAVYGLGEQIQLSFGVAIGVVGARSRLRAVEWKVASDGARGISIIKHHERYAQCNGTTREERHTNAATFE